MTRSRRTARFATVVAVAAALVGVPASTAQAHAGAVAFDCGATSDAAVQWLGGAGVWSDAAKWSGASVPGIGSRTDEVCIPPDSQIEVDGTSPRVDLAAFELGRGSVLTLDPGTALFVWGDQSVYRSVTRPTSVVELDGATLGGAGRLRVMGSLNAHRSSGGSPAVLSTRPLSSSVTGRQGIVQVDDVGTLRALGTGSVHVAKRYVVDVRGRVVLRDDADLRLDHGTALLLQPRTHSPGLGKLLIHNDRGLSEGRWDGVAAKATFVNHGIVVKEFATGISQLDVRYFGGGRVREKSGSVRYLIIAQGVPETGPCAHRDFCTAEQTVAVQIPVTDANGAQVEVTRAQASGFAGAVASPVRVAVTDLQTTVAYPVVLRLEYTLSALRRAGAPLDPAKLDVFRAEGDDPFAVIPSCQRHDIPLGARSCLDRGSSSRSGDWVRLVIRTVELSRWVAR